MAKQKKNFGIIELEVGLYFMESELLDADTGGRIDWKIIGNIHDNPEFIGDINH